MEVVVLLVCCVVAVAFFLSASKPDNRGARDGKRGSDASSSTTRPASNNTTRPPARAQSPTPFDSGSLRAAVKPRTITGKAYVIDGDSIVIKKTQIRLFGIDAPELNHPYGQKSKWAMVNLCKGHVIRAEVTATDDHGRTVAKCYLPDGTDLSAALVEIDLAIDWPKYSGGIYRHLEGPDLRRKLWLADARQKGNMKAWQRFEEKQKTP